MSLQKVIWSTLVGATMIVATLLGSWGKSVDDHLQQQDVQIQKQATDEAVHEQELKDIHQDLLRIEKLLETH